jgi:hypothetical protein
MRARKAENAVAVTKALARPVRRAGARLAARSRAANLGGRMALTQ